MNLIPTREQELIIEEASKGTNLLVKAKAGSAKTSTCVMVAEKLNNKGLYVAFNKAIATEASGKFSPSVTCKTIHSIAYGNIINTRYRKKLQGWFQTNDVKLTYFTGKDKQEARLKVVEAVKKFCQSDYESIFTFASDKLDVLGLEDIDLRNITDYWGDLVNPHHPNKITHDVYLKLFQLNQPILGYDTIFLDECLTEKQLVKTSTGARSIKSLYNSWHGLGRGVKNIPDILSYNVEKQIYEYKPMLGALKSENRKVFRVTTEGLNKLDCTDNHKLLTQRGYVPVRDIKIGKDYILLDSSNNQKSKKVLNSDQYQIMLGGLLGDSHIEKRSSFHTYRISFTQGINQYNYFLEKTKTFGISKIQNIYSGFTKKKTIFAGYSATFILTKSPWDCLTDTDARALAIWYMDDGSLSNCNNISLHTNKYSYQEQLYLVELLSQNFNIKATICKAKNKYYYLHCNKENGEKLLKLISPYMHQNLAYKNPFIPLNYYLWDNKFKPYGGNYISSIEYIGKDTVYDITVADNHNFCTTRVRRQNAVGCIVHNCQDSNPVILDIILRQKQFGSQVILVGDSFQAIYGWRGAVDALAVTPEGFKELYLTESFRFTQEIADQANKVIKFLGSNKLIRGQTALKVAKAPTRATIVRNNSTLLETLLDAYANRLQVFVLADLKSLWSKLYHIDNILRDKLTKYPDKELSQYKTKESLEEAAKTLPEIKKLIGLVYLLRNQGGVYKAISDIKDILTTSQKMADFTLTTAHKSKGLEWDEVTLKEDLFSVPKGYKGDECNLLLEDQIGELLYVAMTRAKTKLNLPENIRELLEWL